jgi:transposase InsO family protein
LLWDEVTINFIIKLLKSTNLATEDKYDLILMMINKLTKYSYIVACKEKFTAEQLKYIVLNRLIRYHDIPKGLTSDRDKLFTSNYWKTLISMLGTRLRMSTAYHPVTNDQTERTNQSLKQYLRHYVNNTYNNWVSLLSMTQLALNAKVSNITKIASFFANYNREFNLFEEERKHLLAQSVIERIATLKRIHDNISKMQERSIKY